jgi:hypothetical protein
VAYLCRRWGCTQIRNLPCFCSVGTLLMEVGEARTLAPYSTACPCSTSTCSLPGSSSLRSCG